VGISLDEDIAKLQRFVAAEGEKIGYAIAADLAGGAQQGEPPG
jgi:choline dehydrogenase-like flavoprotein